MSLSTDSQSLLDQAVGLRAGGARLRLIFATPTSRAGMGLVVAMLTVSFIGPRFVPYDPTLTLGRPYQTASAAHLLGLDVLGRDVLSRVLDGGEAIIIISALSTVLAYAIAIPLGMALGLRHGGPVDAGAMILVDIALAFPPIVLVLGLLAAQGSGTTIVIIGIALVHIPRIVRVVRTVTTELSEREFVEAAFARGESLWSVVFREIMPNVWTPTLADLGLRLTGSIILYTSLSYLGVAAHPPTPNWGLMISENTSGFFINPLPILVPVALTAILSVGANLVSDGVSRSMGRSAPARGQ